MFVVCLLLLLVQEFLHYCELVDIQEALPIDFLSKRRKRGEKDINYVSTHTHTTVPPVVVL